VDQNNLQGAIDGFRAFKARGWNVSVPNKNEVIQYLDHTDRIIDLVGACNTVVNDDGVLTGYNTDGSG
jgi:shikimate 5-dehydrogenase